ncbi:hypothetical protein [Enhygromyxa salina]|uniref:Lipoprotein n=1 Tax=Enhygromyxa salina TaxID=215803 RepID=A0A2S9Y671_9BACT|nr:hypothetical protein [Enhygromyxa salina]PRQ00598.1 hypothetical protein ENSA7_60930 [Enhygromyxa salina]
MKQAHITTLTLSLLLCGSALGCDSSEEYEENLMTHSGTTDIDADLQDNQANAQVKCSIDEIYGTRWRKTWYGGYWEFKYGTCVEYGTDCSDCFARCKDQFTSAGGWTIKHTKGEECQEQI